LLRPRLPRFLPPRRQLQRSRSSSRRPATLAVLLNPAEPTIEAANRRDVEAAAAAMGLQLRIIHAGTIAEVPDINSDYEVAASANRSCATDLEACKVDLYLDQQSIDTTTPMGKLVSQVTSAFAEFERSMIRQRVRAGLRRAVAQGKVLGRPKLAAELEQRIRAALNVPDRPGTRVIARQFGVSRPTVLRIAGDGP
jgi:resolvase-like protein